jgi:hypothetical protein
MYDYTNQRFGRLVVIERNGSKNNRVVWKCKCDCGNVVDVVSQDLTRGHTQSCGCLFLETQTKRLTKHNGTHDRLYIVWQDMKKRCENPNNKSYKYYGARGIKVCKEWHDYSVFKEWAYNNGYDDKAKKFDCTIDRINVNGNYEPNNCRWVDMKVQNANRRNKKEVEE